MKILSISQTTLPDGQTIKYPFGMMVQPDVKSMHQVMKNSILREVGESWRKQFKPKSA